MNNNENISLAYPSGYIEFCFNMYVDHKTSIPCKIDHPCVKEIIFEKVHPSDKFDPKWIMKIIFGEVVSIEEVNEIGNAIKDNIFDLLCLVLETKISEVRFTGHGLTPRQGEGSIAHIVLPSIQFCGTGRSSGMELSSEKVSEIQTQISNITVLKENPLIRIYRYAICNDEPIVQFMMLYLILYEIYKNQSAIDKYIMETSPNTVQTPSPLNDKFETIYTKLRNEITHRTNISHEQTRNEIINTLSEFKEITHKAINSQTNLLG